MKPERVFADTSLFLRYLTNDIPAQADAVEHLLRQAAAGDVLLVVNPFVLAEIIWTLSTYYKLTQDNITEKILAILNTPGMEVADRDLVLQGVTWWHEHNVDFIDAYNAAWLLANGMTDAYTFDRKHFLRLSAIKVRTPGLPGADEGS